MTYHTLDSAPADPVAVTAMSNALRPGEEPVFGIRARAFKFELHDLQMVNLLVTNQRLLVAKDKLFGKPKANVSVELTDLKSSGYGPLMGVGPAWEAHFHTLGNSPAIMYFGGPVEAEAFEKALRGAATAGRAPAQPQPQDGPALPEHPELFRRLHNLVDDLRPLATPGALGQPFGEGAGLEAAVQAVMRNLESPADCRECGTIMMVDLLSESTQAAGSRIPELMGATDEALDRHQVAGDTRDAVRSINGAARQMLAEFSDRGSIWDLWQRRDDVAAEMLCWHTVARLRCATAGLMAELERPSWA